MKRIFLILLLTLIVLPSETLFSCTMFTLTKNGKTLVGNNEDWRNPNTKMWFVLPEEGKYGIVYFGFDDLTPQGGMNDQGLVFDYMATQPLEVKNSLHKETFRGDLMDKVMRECATVEEALNLVDHYNLQYFRSFQVMIVDKSGDSAIIEGDVIQRKKGNFQVCTNFYLSQLKEGDDIPCDRYKIATNLLSKNELTIDAFRNILAAVHQEGAQGGTLYSNIYDVNRGLVYLYHFHNYENVVAINLEDELKKGEHTIDLPTLFPDTFAAIQFNNRHQLPASDVLYKTIDKSGAESGIKEYHRMKNDFRKVYRYDFSEEEINTLGYKLLRAGKNKDAIAIFKLNVEEHPRSWNVYDSLGEAYMEDGQKELAIKFYRKSLDINPDNDNGKEMLKKLEEKKINL